MRYHNVKKLSDKMEGIFKSAMQRRGFYDSRIITNWPLIVGHEIAKSYYPIKISHIGNKQNQCVVYFAIRDRQALLLFPYNKNTILERINTYLGCEKFTKAKILDQQ
jgi:hypothetical protein